MISKIFIAVIVVLIIFGLGRMLIKPGTSPIISPTPVNQKSYTSPRHGYSFQYPDDWQAIFFDEANPDILAGSHSLANYSYEGIENYMDHGIVDWPAFIGNKLAVKLDIGVHDDSVEIPEGAVEQPQSQFQIGSLPTKEYIFTDGNRIHMFVAELAPNQRIMINAYTYNAHDNLYVQDPEWLQVNQILSSFSFQN